MQFGTIWHGPKPSDDAEDKDALRKKIADDVERFLSGGGEIEQCPGLTERPDYARPVYIHKEAKA